MDVNRKAQIRMENARSMSDRCMCLTDPDQEVHIKCYLNQRVRNRFYLSGRNSLTLTGRRGRGAEVHTGPPCVLATVPLNSPALDTGEYLRSLRTPSDMLCQYQDRRWPLIVDRSTEGVDWDGYNVSAGPIGYAWEWKLHPVLDVYVKWGSMDYDFTYIRRSLFARDRLPTLVLIMSQSLTNPEHAYRHLLHLLAEDAAGIMHEQDMCYEQITQHELRSKFLEESNFTGFWDGDEYNQRDIACSMWWWRMGSLVHESVQITCLAERVWRMSVQGTPLPDLAETESDDE